MELFDIHAHVQMKDYEVDRTDVIKRALDQKIGMIVVGTTLTDSVEAVRLAESYSEDPVFASVGIHPTDGDLGEVHPAQLASLLDNPKVKAMGETGLDYFHTQEPEDQDLQADVFEQHIILAMEANLPLIIHTRDRQDVYDAYEDTLTILRRHQVKKFVMHCYSGTWELAEQFLDLGGYLSFTGIVTFPKAEMMQEVAKNTPLDKILVETDAPFLTPEPHRGQRNEPAYVQFTADKIAELRYDQPKVFKATVVANAKTLFGV